MYVLDQDIWIVRNSLSNLALPHSKSIIRMYSMRQIYMYVLLHKELQIQTLQGIAI